MPTLESIEAALVRVRARTTHIVQLAKGGGLAIKTWSRPYITISRDKPSLVQTVVTAHSADPFQLWVKELRSLPDYAETQDIDGHFEYIRKRDEAQRVREEQQKIQLDKERELRLEDNRKQKAILDRALDEIGITELKHVGEGSGPWRASTSSSYIATGNSTEEDLKRVIEKLWYPNGMSVERKSPDQFEVSVWWDTSD